MSEEHSAELLAEAILDVGYRVGQDREISINNITYSVTYYIYTLGDYDTDGVFRNTYIDVNVSNIEAYDSEGEDVDVDFSISEVEDCITELLSA